MAAAYRVNRSAPRASDAPRSASWPRCWSCSPLTDRAHHGPRPGGARRRTSPTRSPRLELPIDEAATHRRPRFRSRASRARARRRAAGGAGPLVESVARKCAFIERAAAAAGLANAEVVAARAEEWGDGLGRCDVVTARALARAAGARRVRSAAAAQGGALVAWKGRRDAEEERDGAPLRRQQLGLSRRGVRRCSVSGRRAPPPPRLPQGRAHAGALPAPRRDGAQAAARCAERVRASSEPCSPATVGGADPPALADRDGHRLRDRQPEGRGRQDDHGGERRRLHRRGGLRDAAGRRRSPGQRDRRPRPAEGRARRASTTCSAGEADARPTPSADRRSSGSRSCRRRPTSPARTSSCRASPGSEHRLRDALAPVRERYAFILLDCPPSLGPLTVNALVAADRVIVPVQTEYFALEGLAGLLDTLSLIQRELNPRLTVAGMLLTMHDGAHAPGAGRRARGARALPRARLRHRHPAQRPARRGAELRAAGHPPRSALRRARTPTSSSPRRWPHVAERPRGMGRGLRARSCSTIRAAGRATATPSCRRAARSS